MRILKYLLSTLLVLVGIFFIGGFFIPSEWIVSRSISIHANPETIYPYVGDFKEWEKWSPWNSSKDATLHYVYEGPDSGVGAKQSWKSDKMGSGSMEFISADPQKGVVYNLSFSMGKSQSTIQGIIDFKPQDDATTVTWRDQGDSGNSYIKRWMSLMIKIMLGKEMKSGLANLKTLVEK